MRRFVHTELCVLLAAAMWLSPLAALRAQLPEPTGKAGVDTRFCTPQTVALAWLQPKRLMESPMAEFLPTEVATAAGLKYVGIDPAQIESLQLVIEPPMGPTLFAGLVAKMAAPVNLQEISDKLLPQIGVQYEMAEEGGRPFLKPPTPELPAAYLPDDKTLVIATMPMLKKWFGKRSASQTGLVMDRISASEIDDDFFLMVDTETLRPLISMGLMQAAQEVPPEAQRFLTAPQYVRDIELSLNITGKAPTQMLLHANDADDAGKLMALVDDAKKMMQAEQQAEIARMLASADTVEQAAGKYMQRMQARINDIKPQVAGDTITLFRVENSEGAANPAVAAAVIGVLVALLLPAVQSAREAARRAQASNNMKQLMLAMHNYHDTRNEFPAHAIYDDNGKPLLSWRVAILPYIEEQALYNQFHLDEPWDSAHNIKLVPQMPQLFADPNTALDPSAGKTNYLGVSGEGHIFEKNVKGTAMRQITDGTSNTLAIVQVSDEQSQIWTKPADFEPDADEPAKGLGGLNAGDIFLGGFCDGSVQVVVRSIDAETLKAMFTRSGGEVIGGF